MRIKKIISFNIALGIKEYAKEYRCKIHDYQGRGEGYVEVDIEGTKKDLIELNKKAENYKPSERLGISMR